MDLQSVVDDIRKDAGDASTSTVQVEACCSETVAAIPSAVKAVQEILQLTGDSLPAICQHIETVSTQQEE